MTTPSHAQDLPSAVLLLGPTGAGKTPLGDELQTQGYRGQRCVHFDFGAQLRHVVGADVSANGIGEHDMAFLRQVLTSGTLLDDEHFHLAEQILRRFLADRLCGGQGWVAMNGLPRHTGQAEAMRRIVEVKQVIELRCTPEVVFRRIRSNAGGDRTGRTDDDLEAVRNKLAIYSACTAPLVDYYRQWGVPVETREVE